jgi:hypothetical protein
MAALMLLIGLMLPMGALAAPLSLPNDITVIGNADICCDSEHVYDDELVYEPTRNEPHCGEGDRMGRLIMSSVTKHVGTDNRNCVHGAVGVQDRRDQWQVTTTWKCTMCAYYFQSAGNPYWGNWYCLL